ncbi:MAG: HEPN domain-containing protein [Pseudonocardiaceae bacterium]
MTANRAELRREPGLLAAQMNLFACRIYLTPERAAGLIHGPLRNDPAAPGHTMIDLRFREHLGRYWLYATFSVCTHQPSLTLDSAKPREDCPDTSLLIEYADALRRGFQDHLYTLFPTARMMILDRKYQPPQFWVAWGRDLAMTGTAATNGHKSGQRELLGRLLSVPYADTTGLGGGDIDGRMRVFRRFISSPRWAHDRPVYLILLFASAEIKEIDQENYLRLVVQRLSDLEADAATRLFDIVTDIDMYRSQLNLYQKIAAEGLALWDQVALFLPVARGTRLGGVHRLIELIHQIVLQGIADLEQEAADAQQTIERIEVVANDLMDQFDRKFTERPVPGRLAIRDSLVKAGYFDKARRAAKSVHEQSRHVRATYKALLDSMTYAFDERRVRETDVLQWVALSLAIALGAVSTWNEFLSQYITTWDVGPWVGFGGVAIIVVIIAVLLMRSRRSRLTSSRFNRRFAELQDLLAACSSDHLVRLRAADEQDSLNALADDKRRSDEAGTESRHQIVATAQEQARERHAKYWRLLDKKLAEKTAALLDDLSESPPTRHDPAQSLPKVKLGELNERVEDWALRALLVTEQPRKFHRSSLPLLTFLYRFFPIISGKPSQESDWSAAESQVSDYDFRLTVENHCGGEPGNVPTLTRWGHRKVRELPSASEFVKELQRIGLSGHMTNERFSEMMNKVNGSFWNPGEFKDWGKEAVENLRAAKSLRDNNFYQKACLVAEDSAQLGLTGFLRGVGADVPTDYGLVRLSVEVRATRGRPLPAELQEAIWRLSAYQKPRDQLGIHPAGRAAPREFGRSDAETALDDAETVLRYVDEWTHGGLRSSGLKAASQG